MATKATKETKGRDQREAELLAQAMRDAGVARAGPPAARGSAPPAGGNTAAAAPPARETAPPPARESAEPSSGSAGGVPPFDLAQRMALLIEAERKQATERRARMKKRGIWIGLAFVVPVVIGCVIAVVRLLR